MNEIELYAEIERLKIECTGPDGFQTWRDAAIYERLLRVGIERKTRIECAKICNTIKQTPDMQSWGCGAAACEEAILKTVK
jgi:hypothetical protein